MFVIFLLFNVIGCCQPTQRSVSIDCQYDSSTRELHCFLLKISVSKIYNLTCLRKGHNKRYNLLHQIKSHAGGNYTLRDKRLFKEKFCDVLTFEELATLHGSFLCTEKAWSSVIKTKTELHMRSQAGVTTQCQVTCDFLIFFTVVTL